MDARRLPSDEGKPSNMDPTSSLSTGVANMMGPRRSSEQGLNTSASHQQYASRSNNNSGPPSGTTSPRPALTPRSSSKQGIASPKLDASQMGSVHDGHAYSEATTRSSGPGPEGKQAALSDFASSDVQSSSAAQHGRGSSAGSAVIADNPNSGPSASTSQPQQNRTPSRRTDQTCDACKKPMTGQFVRALGVVYHLDCFRCRDCNKVVAAKFFPATDEMSSSPAGSQGSHDGKQPSPTSATSGGKLFPLCETDYFRRLDLLCANCGGALRGSYITALGKKFHVEHFTCSICPTVFGPQDSYYEHDGRVFCHFHYSTRFAIRCTGCRTAILKQFVEINRNNQDEHWHPECYMIHKFWNIKLCPTGSTPRENVASEPTMSLDTPDPINSGVAPVSNMGALDTPSPETLETEAHETPVTLKDKQKQMEEQVYRIWTVLSAFEESSAACISDMLRQVSNGKYLGGVRMAERFILHVEVLFAAVDELETAFRREQAKGISHIREARMLCKKVVNFFSLLSHTQETGAQRMGITQELLSLVTGLAHYLKILIRIALTGALRLERDFDDHSALDNFLDRLASLAQEGESPVTKATQALRASNASANGESNSKSDVLGYKSLPRSTSSTFGDGAESATDLCVACGQTVEEECARMGINLRWHTACIRCQTCRRSAQRDPSSSKALPSELTADPNAPESLPSQDFRVEVIRRSQDLSYGSHGPGYQLYCPTCYTASSNAGVERVTRLEQYSYLLRVALNRLYALLKKRGVVPASPPVAASPPAALSMGGALADWHSDTTMQKQGSGSGGEQVLEASTGEDGILDSQDLRRMKGAGMERKLSTKAKVPHISAVVGSPSGQLPAVQKQASPLDMSALRSPSPGAPKTAVERIPSDGGEGSAPRTRDVSPSRRPPPPRSHLAPIGRADEPQYVGTQKGPIVPIRPAFARHNTDVRIQDQGPIRQPSGDDSMPMIADPDEQLTLADIPQLLQQEQAREQHRRLPSFDGRAVADLSALELFVVKHMAVLMLQQGPLKDYVAFDELIDFIDIRKNTFWGKLFKGGKDKKKVEKKGTFSIPLDALVERNGADCTLGSTSTVLRVPSFIDDIISAMRQMDVTVEGIFRKNGNIRRLKDLTEALDRDASSVNLSDDNPVQLAALLKKWLRELPDPLLTFKLHRLFVMSQNVEPENERLRCLHLLSILLPKAHRDTMEVIFVFLRWVASFSHIDEETGSKMDLQNLAMVLGPNILYSKGSDPAKDELFLANRAILALLEYQDVFWRVPHDLEIALQDRELLNTSNDLTSRDILKRCEKYARRARSGTFYTTVNGGGGGGNGNGRQQAGGGIGPGSGPTFPSQRGGMFAGTMASDIPLSSSTIRSLADQSYPASNPPALGPRRGSQQQSPTQNEYIRSSTDPNSINMPPPWAADVQARQSPRQPAGPQASGFQSSPSMRSNGLAAAAAQQQQDGQSDHHHAAYS